ncbi:hypothetical protein GCM10023340_05040 [Nocardioides marinquilinus]|uniref:Mycothiol-dependent maleylpyruvate isomerase metal-binding domain-containing protein n=1 Tax=Nocardioides marinquilinus TaxID=1210400 RepID=A0ABP9PCI0_9ACTN
MSAPPDGAVELVERALAYTRGALHGVTPGLLGRPTPCAGWDLDRLLAHMDDALDAFTEGAGGAVAPAGPDHAPSLPVRLGALQTKACALLGAWTSSDLPDVVHVDEVPVPTAVVASAAALEITLHGWDVAQATGRATPIPAGLATGLLPLAHALVVDDDRAERFAGALPAPPGADPATRLLAFAGRSPVWARRLAS